MRGRLIIVSNRLPVSITEEGGSLVARRSIGGLATALGSVYEQQDSVWVGWTGLRKLLSDDEIKGLNLCKRLVPINLCPDTAATYYDHVANQVLWPLFHNLEPTTQLARKEWDVFRKAADMFAEKIAHILRPHDVIWIHDYHLTLLPAALRKRGIKNRIGHFWHTPFPHITSLKKLPFADELLANIRSLDMLGLQTQRDVQACKNTIKLGSTQVKHVPIGIDVESFRRAGRLKKTRQRILAERASLAGKKAIFSISRLDYTKGILVQLDGFAQFLQSLSSAERKKYVYKLVVAPSREDVDAYQKLKRDIEAKVAQINARFGTVVAYEYTHYDLEDLTVWYNVSEVLLSTPVIDGMNLIVKEFVAARGNSSGVLVMSGTMGAAFQLQQALHVRPNSPAEIAGALDVAFAMTSAEKDSRWKALRHNVETEHVFWWAERFLDALHGKAGATPTHAQPLEQKSVTI